MTRFALALSLVAGAAFAHDGAPGDHMNIGYYFGHDDTFENPASPPWDPTLLVDTHPWELDDVYFRIDPVSGPLLEGWSTNLPGFDTLPIDEQEFGGHGFYSWMDPLYDFGAPSLMLHVDHVDDGLQILVPFTLQPLPTESFLGTDFHLHVLFYVDQSVAPDPDQIFSATFHISDANGELADSAPFTLQFAINPPCDIDMNGDTVLDIFDVTDFLAVFDAQEPLADWNEDGEFNIFDLVAYLADFDAGCP